MHSRTLMVKWVLSWGKPVFVLCVCVDFKRNYASL